ncbi:MAG: zf-HC2 domain-containing protein [Candidatus Hydrogenedentes bacterium]|nr:zf-HC2 domain-containing protein [Candidatus Hydrogenedentota bacterium]
MPCPDSETLMELAIGAATGVAQHSAGDAAIHAHLASCAPCTSAYSEWLLVAQAGRQAVAAPGSAGECPDENSLAEYLDGILPGLERRALELHFAACPPCLRQLCEVHSLLAEAQRATAPHKIALQWLKEGLRLVSAAADVFTPVTLNPAPVLWGREMPDALAWDMAQDGYHLRIALQHSGPARLNLHLALQLDGAPAPGPRILLRHGGAILESRVMDELGSASFLGLEAANYDVEIGLPERSLRFEVETTPAE